MRIRASESPEGHPGTLALGLVSGLVASQCATPVLAAILTYVMAEAALVYGASLLFVYALGRGVPVVLAGTFAGALKQLLAMGRWSTRHRAGSGCIDDWRWRLFFVDRVTCAHSHGVSNMSNSPFVCRLRIKPCSRCLDCVLAATRPLLAFDVAVQHAATRAAVCGRAAADADDVILLDWGLAVADTPSLIEDFSGVTPICAWWRCSRRPRAISGARVWATGACASIHRGTNDQEWLASVLCILYRALAREARLHATPAGATDAPIDRL